ALPGFPGCARAPPGTARRRRRDRPPRRAARRALAAALPPPWTAHPISLPVPRSLGSRARLIAARTIAGTGARDTPCGWGSRSAARRLSCGPHASIAAPRLLPLRMPLSAITAERRGRFDNSSPLTRSLTRGVCRMLTEAGFGPITEFRLPNRRRADVIALGAGSEFLIVEVKS